MQVVVGVFYDTAKKYLQIYTISTWSGLAKVAMTCNFIESVMLSFSDRSLGNKTIHSTWL